MIEGVCRILKRMLRSGSSREFSFAPSGHRKNIFPPAQPTPPDSNPMNRLLIASAIALVAALSAEPAQAQKADSPSPPAGPECIVDIDVNDEVWLRNHKMTEADVNELVPSSNRTAARRC